MRLPRRRYQIKTEHIRYKQRHLETCSLTKDRKSGRAKKGLEDTAAV